MEASTTMRKMLQGNTIVVPSYQRAYSWDTPVKDRPRKTHTDVFLADLEERFSSKASSPYYFGHFLFEENNGTYCVIDGQQRLTTIVIFLSVLFSRLKHIRKLSEKEEECYEDMVKRHSTIRFSTVNYDSQLFEDYVINQIKTDHHGLKTVSSHRIVDAFDFFKEQLSNKPAEYLTKMLDIVSNAACTTHPVTDESEAIQMFIFQNNRGKDPSNLEIVKAQFMYMVHLYGEEKKDALIKEITNRFETIYKSISSIEAYVDEDDILLYTLRVYFNNLSEGAALDKIQTQLSKPDPIPFIQSFTQSLATSFGHLTTFFTEDERKNFAIHSLITLGGTAIALPFVIKAYTFDLNTDNIGALCGALETLVLRHRLIGTRADMAARINDVYQGFSKTNTAIQPIADRIKWMKTTKDWWWAYWNDEAFENALQGGIEHSAAKYLLWKYENNLEGQGQDGYVPTRYDRIIDPELEHIAPTTEPEVRPHGYDEYTQEFRNQYIECLGNYLLLSKSHNCVVGNRPFAEKHRTYTHNEQQREIQKMIPENEVWGKAHIQPRKDRIIRFIMDNL